MNDFIGIPYAEHGRDYTGADCWGMVFLYYRDVLNTPVPSYEVEMSSREFRPKAISPLVMAERDANWTQTQTPKQGDVVVMRNGMHEGHVGIYLDGGLLLHSDGEVNSGYSCIERLDGPAIRNRIVGYFRLAQC